MDDKSLVLVLDRLDRLEEENRSLTIQIRRFKRVGVAVLLGISISVTLVASNTSRSGVVVTDPVTGSRIADMVATNAGGGGFQVWDRAGRRRILLGTNNQGQAGLTFWDANGQITDRFWQTPAGGDGRW